MNDMNMKICDVLKNDFCTVELRLISDKSGNAQEMRLYIMDSDDRYVDDWAYDVGENISKQLDIIKMYGKDCAYFSALIAEVFDKEIYYKLSVEEYHNMIIERGADFVNRIGSCVLVTKE